MIAYSVVVSLRLEAGHLSNLLRVFKTKGGGMTRPTVTHFRDSLTSLILPQLIRQ